MLEGISEGASPQKLLDSAKDLITEVCNKTDPFYGLSTASCQVYDTAWVAMVVKRLETGEDTWAFPLSFQYILRAQASDGGWGVAKSSRTAGILDTAAALLTLYRHLDRPLQIMDVTRMDLQDRIERASKSLVSQLQQWDDLVESNHIGVELILPSLLEQLRQVDPLLRSTRFTAEEDLLRMNAEKLRNFDVSSLYGSRPSSALHSLEAFLGKIDFDRVSHHLYHGSMMASPSSTAAYLIGASTYDVTAEAYLTHILDRTAGQNLGGIPGTCPITNFEYSWVTATLLRDCFTYEDLGSPALDCLGRTLEEAFQAGKGVIGFAPRTADVDDTAKGLLALTSMRRNTPADPRPMIKVFERDDHFTTFGSERDPSFTSNCHVLLSLLAQESDLCPYRAQIHKATKFLCDFLFYRDGPVKDKWHMTSSYPSMLLVEAFSELLRLQDKQKLDQLLTFDEQHRVYIVLFQTCLRTLLAQNQDGSWNGCTEQTAHAICTLARAWRLNLFFDMRSDLRVAIQAGIRYLDGPEAQEGQNWTSKTVYSVDLVGRAYILAARKMALDLSDRTPFGPKREDFIPMKKFITYLETSKRLPLLQATPLWQISASLTESALFLPLLRKEKQAIFPRDGTMLTPDDYIDIIPYTWVICSNRIGIHTSPSLTLDMMLLSMYGYQVDEFFESHAMAGHYQSGSDLKRLVDDVLQQTITACAGLSNGISKHDTAAQSPTAQEAAISMPEMSAGLIRFISYILKHPSVINAHPTSQSELHRELRAFLHAHCDQSDENRLFAAQESWDELHSPSQTLFQYVRTTGGDHVACAYSLSFMLCLISSSIVDGGEVFRTAEEKYLAAAAARHLTTMCRIYNDYGSLARDTAEHNVNSMHYPEFRQTTASGHDPTKAKKKALLSLGEYEQDFLRDTLDRLEKFVATPTPGGRVESKRLRGFRLFRYFCDVTDLYDQLYVLKDLSSSLRT
ncbi:copalyldiphosphate/kaurene synthase [Elsinoe ampelina]|uniref:Copalyldiphosphate/kaurene synthase n=1 Tax=Elsinoe ampelina TaxID=302913 RepID=A0A6A6GE03_9PEZI|nr:copalyldiphosphate/kaurene synthase [Elsinoe ampelina]